MSYLKAMLLTVLGLLLVSSAAWTEDDDDDKAPAASGNPDRPALSSEQQQAVGISVLHPLRASSGEHIEGYGEVLDAASLITDAGHLASTRAAAHAADTEAARLQTLYNGGADASLRAVESAQAAQIEAQTQAQIASSSFALQWGPLARLSEVQRRALIEAVSSGETLLLRADLPGRLRLGTVPKSATLHVDGTQVSARVLGTLQRSASESQSVALLLQVDHAPTGLGAGARLLVSLAGEANGGVLVPNAALLYGEQGAYVYRQLPSKTPDGKQQYAPVPVKLLQSAGNAWLVEGIDTDDTIVANGAGVLWSLQGLGTFTAEEEDHD
jgi:hypothetical protein